MRPLRWVIVLGVLLGLSRAESQVIDNDVDDPVGAGGDGGQVEDALQDDAFLNGEEPQQPGQGVDEVEATETTEASEQRKLYPYEQQWLEAELRWQHDMEELEKREREEAMRDLDQVTDDNEHQNYLEEHYEQSDRVDEDDNNNDVYQVNQRRLDQASDQSSDGNEEEEEVVPVVPGLTDVELFAFNVEFAKEEILDKIIDWSYDQVAAMSRFRDNYIHVEDLYDFLLKTLNPLDEEIDEEDERILTDAVTELRRQQGLVDKEQVVYRGFIARGMPLRFLQSLAHEMHQTVQKRRLQVREEL